MLEGAAIKALEHWYGPNGVHAETMQFPPAGMSVELATFDKTFRSESIGTFTRLRGWPFFFFGGGGGMVVGPWDLGLVGNLHSLEVEPGCDLPGVATPLPFGRLQ